MDRNHHPLNLSLRLEAPKIDLLDMPGIEEFTPDFFDESSKAWMMNKKRAGCSYEYVCKKEKCKNKCFKNTDWCKWHQSQIVNELLRRSERIASKLQTSEK
jgi:hypothetical protein